jgi:hypothetical protein
LDLERLIVSLAKTAFDFLFLNRTDFNNSACRDGEHLFLHGLLWTLLQGGRGRRTGYKR